MDKHENFIKVLVMVDTPGFTKKIRKNYAEQGQKYSLQFCLKDFIKLLSYFKFEPRGRMDKVAKLALDHKSFRLMDCRLKRIHPPDKTTISYTKTLFLNYNELTPINQNFVIKLFSIKKYKIVIYKFQHYKTYAFPRLNSLQT